MFALDVRVWLATIEPSVVWWRVDWYGFGGGFGYHHRPTLSNQHRTGTDQGNLTG